MISYIYMLLITVICYLWQGIAKEQVDFFKMASTNTSVNMKYDYLYTAIVNASSLCNHNSCSSGMTVNLPNYKSSYQAIVCEHKGTYYAFYTDAILTQKPTVSLTPDSDFSLIRVKNIPSICKTQSNTSNEENYALSKNS
ncbi:TPA: hypothetical protein JLB60_004386 [Escherichia coli]|nr:hypothetical protein [Escherichia coli]